MEMRATSYNIRLNELGLAEVLTNLEITSALPPGFEFQRL